MTDIENPADVDRTAVGAEVARVQARTVRVLAVTQVVGGVGALAGTTAGGLLAASVAGDPAAAGYAQGSQVAGAALLALPIVLIMQRFGRRRGMVAGFTTGLVGACVAVLGGWTDSLPVLMAGLILYGAATATSLQSRYAATDLATPAQRARALSTVVWAATAGVAIGPNLVGPTAAVAERAGLPPLTGAYVFAAAAFLVAATVAGTMLRPDPLLLSRRVAGEPTRPAPGGTWVPRLTTPPARLALMTMVVSHSVMLPLMVITPVHMAAAGTGLTVIGAAASTHVLGMYVLSPLAGRLCDRFGRRAGLVSGSTLLLTATVVAGTAGHDSWRLTAGLVLLGVGWSACLVSGSLLLSESVPAERRLRVQGTADMTVGLCAATGGLIAGPVVGTFGFAGLTLGAGVMVLCLIAVQVHALLGGRAG
ncbi:MFS transporter [Nonomuraea basaltis]|uniref:MFS transporter n=1 Tax=Nonomuraea basaltis TaxID=2495887 RepID=UPI00110C4103|nr:MFS transporter [Nonomuraea basaltis]TMR99144.1 MFS transporter [Nonomuraea basaltis]